MKFNEKNNVDTESYTVYELQKVEKKTKKVSFSSFFKEPSSKSVVTGLKDKKL